MESIFHHFKGLSVPRSCLRPESVPLKGGPSTNKSIYSLARYDIAKIHKFNSYYCNYDISKGLISERSDFHAIKNLVIKNFS